MPMTNADLWKPMPCGESEPAVPLVMVNGAPAAGELDTVLPAPVTTMDGEIGMTADPSAMDETSAVTVNFCSAARVSPDTRLTANTVGSVNVSPFFNRAAAAAVKPVTARVDPVWLAAPTCGAPPSGPTVWVRTF